MNDFFSCEGCQFLTRASLHFMIFKLQTRNWIFKGQESSNPNVCVLTLQHDLAYN